VLTKLPKEPEDIVRYNPDGINLHGILSLPTITVVKNALNSEIGNFVPNGTIFLKL